MNECRSKRDEQGNIFPLGKSLGCPFIGPQVESDPVIPITVEDMLPEEN